MTATARTAWLDLQRSRLTLGPASSIRAIFESAGVLLASALGFAAPAAIDASDHRFAATLSAGSGRAAFLVTPWAEPLDRYWRLAVIEALGRGAPWALLFNGTHLRIVDAVRLFARRSVEFDLAIALDSDRGVAALSAVAGARMFDGGPTGTPLHALVLASEQHAAGVSRSLRSGVLTASAAIASALAVRRGRAPDAAFVAEVFEQALTIVYRLLFLLFAESRRLVPLWHPVYRHNYSIDALREAAERSRHGAGLWDALRAVSRLAHSGCRAGDLQVTPFNGRLFSPNRTPLAEQRHLDDEAARRAVLALATRVAPDGTGLEPIAYRDLGVEQLGAVYETLLDYEPRIARSDRHGRSSLRHRIIELHPGSGVRKATGTFYTPQPLADYLVRRTLGPLVRETSPDAILRLRVVDPAMGSGAFLVAACRYLASAYETALVAHGGYRPSDFGESDRVSIRRTIAERCLYGVDLNPMAVQLARLSLWLATLAADCPLTFLDHHLRVGDSLLGAWLAQLRHRPAPSRRLGGADRRVGPALFPDDGMREAIRTALPVRFTLEETSGDAIERVRAKERALASLERRGSQLSKWKRVADVWCASWFSGRTVPPEAFGALSDVILNGCGSLPRATAAGLLEAAAGIAAAKRFFHWELEFPEAFFDASGARLPRGGFDAVIGNPPWDMIRADAGPAERRDRERDDLATFASFVRRSSAYEAVGPGHINRFQLFVERAMALNRPGGRFGLVLPGGLATDSTSAPLRRRLFSRCNVDHIVGFDNRHGVFPVHRSVRFLLLTASAGKPTREIACRFGEHDPSALETIGDTGNEAGIGRDARSIRLGPAFLERLSGPDLSIPHLHQALDLAILERVVALFPPLGDAAGWGASFGRELNATDDRGLFVEAGRGLPVIEGRQIQAFAVDVGSSRHAVPPGQLERRRDRRRFERPRLAYRDVASATNRMTLIAAILPPRSVSTHTVFCLRTPLPLRSQWFLCGLFNSFVVNYLVRMRVTTHVTTAIVERVPTPRAVDAPRAIREIAGFARLLSRRADGAASAALQARVADLYRLTAAEFSHVLDTFPLVARAERDAALAAFQTLSSCRFLTVEPG